MEEDKCPVILVTKAKAKHVKTVLEKEKIYNDQFKIKAISATTVAIPVKEYALLYLDNLLGGITYTLDRLSLDPSSKMSKNILSPENLKSTVTAMLRDKGISITDDLQDDFPRRWVKYASDMVVFPSHAFSSPFWMSDNKQNCLWICIATYFGVSRVARESTIYSDDFRSPKVELVHGNDGWVSTVNNGIKYTLDVTKSMFSSGNITEKIRIANLDCSKETIVDLYAGVGYFVLPFLVHAHAKLVYACEWNPVSVEALKRNLKLNNVEKQCIVLEGDNRETAPSGIADRVHLGLIPSSASGWPVACRALNPAKGGWLHIHGNVDAAHITHENARTNRTLHYTTNEAFNDSRNKHRIAWENWASEVTGEIKRLLTTTNDESDWRVVVQHIEHVKSYAPHVDHIVLDMECRPHVKERDE